MCPKPDYSQLDRVELVDQLIDSALRRSDRDEQIYTLRSELLRRIPAKEETPWEVLDRTRPYDRDDDDDEIGSRRDHMSGIHGREPRDVT